MTFLRTALTKNGNCQNDNQQACQDPAELAVVKAEGSVMGPMLRAVNTIAAAISHDHPAVAVETLAYQQTRGVPKITRPHPNVIVRVCSIVSH